MVDIPYELMKGVPLGGAGDRLVDLVNAGRHAACSLYKSAPGQMVANNGLPDPLGVGAASRALWDTMCSDRPLPPPPGNLLPGGGQCNKPYRVFFTGQFQSEPIGEFSRVFYGPLKGLTLGPTGAGPALQYKMLHSTSSGAPDETIMQVWDTTNPANNGNSLAITRIEATDGVDDCGTMLPQLPSDRRPSSDYDKPIPYPGPGPGPDIPWRLPPVNWPGIDLKGEFKPTIVIDVGGITVAFDFRGANILPINIDVPITIGGPTSGPGANPLPPRPAPKPIDGDLLADRFDRIQDLIKELDDCVCDKPPGSLEYFQGADVSSQCISTSPSRIRYARLSMTHAPANPKKEWGENAPDVMYAGWAWWKDGDHLYERMPIDAQGKIFKAPRGATAFCYTFRQGYRGFPVLYSLP